MHVRRGLIPAFGAAVLVIALAAAGWACTNLATMNLSESAVEAGGTVKVTGSSFSMTGDNFAKEGVTPVEIRWDKLDGPVLATTTADPGGFISASVTVPGDATPGNHVLVAVQNVQTDDGLEPAYGTPARAPLTVGSVAPVAEPRTSPGVLAASPTSATAGSTAGWFIALTVMLGLVGIGLFAVGLRVSLGARERKPVTAPVTSE